MGTKAVIALKYLTFCEAIVLNCDGYISWAGAILADCYCSQEKVSELISLGELSHLEDRVKPGEHESHSFEAPAPGVTIAYHRDREEVPLCVYRWPNSDDGYLETLSTFVGAEYIYLFVAEKDCWFVFATKGFSEDELETVPDAQPGIFYSLERWV